MSVTGADAFELQNLSGVWRQDDRNAVLNDMHKNSKKLGSFPSFQAHFSMSPNAIRCAILLFPHKNIS